MGGFTGNRLDGVNGAKSRYLRGMAANRLQYVAAYTADVSGQAHDLPADLVKGNPAG